MRGTDEWTSFGGSGGGLAHKRAGRAEQTCSNTRRAPVPNRKSYPFGAPPARIYRPSRSVMQAGRANTKFWVLVFEPTGNRWVEPLIGWSATNDPFAQIRLRFGTLNEAVAYAEREGLDYRVVEPELERRVPKTYIETISGRPTLPRRRQCASGQKKKTKGDVPCWT